MQTVLNIVQIIISVILTALIILQAQGGLGGIFGGGGGSVYRTRRGMEKTMFQFTIILAIAFLVISMLSVKLAAWG
jgi:preprotein translocase subunit SecG